MGVQAQHCPPGLHALWGLRAAGVVGGRARGRWPATVLRGVWCQALSLPRPPVLWGGQPGFRDPYVPGAVGAGVGTQHRPYGARPCGPALRAMGVAEGRPRGGAVCRCEGCLGSGAPPPPAARPLGGLPGRTTRWLWVRGGAGVGTHLQPHSARSCELALRAVGAARGRPGGAPRAWVWGVRGRALSHPELPALWAGCRGPPPTGCGCGGVRTWGRVTNPTARALACCVGGMRVPGGGVFCLGVGRPGSGALPPPTARPLGGLPGPTTHWLWVRGGASVGTRHQPHSAGSCELGLRAVGAAGGRPGGAPPAWVWGVRGRALSYPRLPALWEGCRGPLPTGSGCGGVRVWGPVTNPTARALARCGGGMLVPGGGTFCLGVGRLGSALSHPRLPALWAGCRGPLPTGCGCGGVRAWGPVNNPTARALASWLCALWGRHEGARGGRLLPWCGASGVGRSPTPDCPPSGGAAGAHYPLAVGAGGCGHGDPSPTPQRALLRAGFARCGGGTRAPGGGASCLGVGRPGSGALPPPTARPLAGLTGPTTHWLWVWGGAGVGTRHQPHSARSCVLRGRHEGARGGRLLPGCGASGVGRSATPGCPPSGRAAGTHYPLAAGVGGCGRGDPSPTPQRALLQAGFARCGGGMRVPGGGGRLLPRCGAPRGRALSHPRLPTLWAGCRGRLPTGCGCGGVRAWGPVTNPTAHALASWLCALWARHEGARGWRLLPGCGASEVGRSPTPDCPPSGRAAGAHYPLAVDAGGCGRGDPSPTPQRALLRAVGVA